MPSSCCQNTDAQERADTDESRSGEPMQALERLPAEPVAEMVNTVREDPQPAEIAYSEAGSKCQRSAQMVCRDNVKFVCHNPQIRQRGQKGRVCQIGQSCSHPKQEVSTPLKAGNDGGRRFRRPTMQQRAVPELGGSVDEENPHTAKLNQERQHRMCSKEADQCADEACGNKRQEAQEGIYSGCPGSHP